ncbi:VAM3 [Candida margitis]|uniref:VAM3 n=1 Tax=Candida margitis TaxID=1775924 RepID=UPI002225CDA4|nr:VAM3 [Candida margitis]KAI5959977.1 VAM3 [Candida margitis]
MSFANIDLEAQKKPLLQKGTAESYTETSDLDRIIDKTSKQLQTFNQQISQFDQQRRQLGSRRDCLQLRSNIDASIEHINELYNAIQHLISNLSQLINVSAGDKSDSSDKVKVSSRHIVIKERLVSEFNELDKKFKRLVKVYQEKKRVTPIVSSQGDHKETKNDEPRQVQQQIQLESELDQNLVEQTELQYHLQLTEERNREIEQVTEGIMEVNSIFKDLDQLIHQQGEQLNTVEDNILQLHGNTQQADRELTKANNYQKSKGKWSCILLTALTIIVLIIVLAVVS